MAQRKDGFVAVTNRNFHAGPSPLGVRPCWLDVLDMFHSSDPATADWHMLCTGVCDAATFLRLATASPEGALLSRVLRASPAQGSMMHRTGVSHRCALRGLCRGLLGSSITSLQLPQPIVFPSQCGLIRRLTTAVSVIAAAARRLCAGHPLRTVAQPTSRMVLLTQQHACAGPSWPGLATAGSLSGRHHLGMHCCRTCKLTVKATRCGKALPCQGLGHAWRLRRGLAEPGPQRPRIWSQLPAAAQAGSAHLLHKLDA